MARVTTSGEWPNLGAPYNEWRVAQFGRQLAQEASCPIRAPETGSGEWPISGACFPRVASGRTLVLHTKFGEWPNSGAQYPQWGRGSMRVPSYHKWRAARFGRPFTRSGKWPISGDQLRTVASGPTRMLVTTRRSPQLLSRGSLSRKMPLVACGSWRGGQPLATRSNHRGGAHR